MKSRIQSVPLDKLLAHPGSPNKMSSSAFARLVRNIERAGRYEPLIVRPHRRRKGKFQIINGRQRLKALRELGHDKAEIIVWDVDDEQTDILLGTLNRLKGSDELAKKIALLKRLAKKTEARQLGKLLPQTPGQIKRLTELKMPEAPAEVKPSSFAKPLVFFVSEKQHRAIQQALANTPRAGKSKTKAQQNAAALTAIAHHFLDTTDQRCDLANPPL